MGIEYTRDYNFNAFNTFTSIFGKMSMENDSFDPTNACKCECFKKPD